MDNQQIRFIKQREVLNRTGMSRSALYRAVDENKFPQIVKVGRAAFWIEAEVQAWLEQRVAASRCDA